MPTITPTAGPFIAAAPLNCSGDTEVAAGLTVPVPQPELPYTGATDVPDGLPDGFATPDGCPLGAE